LDQILFWRPHHHPLLMQNQGISICQLHLRVLIQAIHLNNTMMLTAQETIWAHMGEFGAYGKIEKIK